MGSSYKQSFINIPASSITPVSHQTNNYIITVCIPQHYAIPLKINFVIEGTHICIFEILAHSHVSQFMTKNEILLPTTCTQ